ncbi:hypothetical protein MNB_SV-10-896 [hydrothermal vent metagenome]|uniref:Uncharacterized protein n=1 Tax=hydrothermal vent metagenome TaxID=652676 RepID=A0A1W1CMU3_9ZZZZ
MTDTKKTVEQLIHEEKYEEAHSILMSLFHEKNDDAEVYYMLGTYFNAVGDISNAVRSFKKSSELKPNDSEYFLALGMAYEVFDEPKLAVDAYFKVIELNHETALAMQRLEVLKRKVKQV